MQTPAPHSHLSLPSVLKLLLGERNDAGVESPGPCQPFLHHSLLCQAWGRGHPDDRVMK